MGRRPTKAANNPFCQARLAAGEWNEKFYSKEYAAELLHISAGQLQDYELGITKCIPPDNILRMADIYNAPELRNMYCREMCPLGEDTPKVEVEDLDRIVIRIISSLRRIGQTEESLLNIVEDGHITEEKKPELKKVIDHLDELSAIEQNLKIWVEKNLDWENDNA